MKPSQYRNLVKGWDKSKYAELFGGKYRIYIPLGEKAKDVKPNPEVDSFVKSQGYEIEDYLTGIASKDNGKRKVRIGKLLSKETDLKKLFDNDPSRNSSQSEYIVVISRHPYDIAGMTSGRAWGNESCMNLETGRNRQYIPLDIKEGTLVAYLIKKIDKNIVSPSARVLIKPFITLDGSGEVALGVEEKVYGNPNSDFRQTVVNWVDKVNKEKKVNGIFELNKKLYNDSFNDRTIIIGDLTEASQLIVVKRDGKLIKHIIKKGIDPSEVVQMEAAKKSGFAIEYIDNPSEAVQLEAVKQIGGNVIEYIIEKGIIPSEAVQLEAVKKSGFAIEYIIKKGIVPSEQVQLEAVKKKGSLIYNIVNEGIEPSEAVQLAAVKTYTKSFQYIKNPTEAVKKYYEEHK